MKQKSRKNRTNPGQRSTAAADAGGLRSKDTRRQIFLALSLALITLAIYSPVRTHAFVNYDDDDYITRNSHIRSGLSWQSVEWALTATAQANWHPVTWISHAADCQLFELDPTGHHLTNLALHIANVLILFFLLAAVTGSTWRSLMVAALFALHPINVESVAWVAERKNVLSTFFFLIALGAYGRYARVPGFSRYMIVVATFVLALASKPMVVTFPFVLLLIDYWPLRRIQGWSAPAKAYPVPQVAFSRCVFEKIPLFVLAAASCVITVIAQHAGGAVRTMDDFSVGVRLQNAAYSYGMYLWKALWPARLAVLYPHPGTTLSSWQVSLCLLFLLAATGLAWSARSVAPYLLVGWLWFLGTLVPVIGVVQVGAQAMADRYAYVPLIGIFVASIWGLGQLCDQLRIKTQWRGIVAVAALAIFSWITWRQVGYWQDSYSLWSHALTVTRDNPLSENQLGMALVSLDRQEEAMERFQRAIALGTRDPTSYLNLGAYLSEHGRQREAIPYFETALGMGGDIENRVLTYLNLGFAYTSVGDYRQARASFRESLRLDPEQVSDTMRALARFTAAHPSVRDYMKLGLLLEQAGRLPEAETAFEQALRLDPGLDDARTAIAAIRSSH
jgi:tetratricopeptide (TPR) repeat protein